MFKYFALIVFVFSLWIMPAMAEDDNIEVYFFFSPTCSHCDKIKGELDTLKEKYPQLEIKGFDVYTNPENQELFNQIGPIYGKVVQSVPSLLINDKVLIGGSQANVNSLEKEIEYCSTEKCEKPSEKIAAWQKENDSGSTTNTQKIIYVLIGIGIVVIFVVIIFFTKGRKPKKVDNGSNSQPTPPGGDQLS